MSARKVSRRDLRVAVLIQLLPGELNGDDVAYG